MNKKLFCLLKPFARKYSNEQNILKRLVVLEQENEKFRKEFSSNVKKLEEESVVCFTMLREDVDKLIECRKEYKINHSYYMSMFGMVGFNLLLIYIFK